MQQLAADGKVQLLGIIQEQHPDRCRLFAQWQNFDWPILHDPINQIPTRAVPLVIAIDEHGIVRSTRPQPDWVINTFLTTDYAAPDARTPPLAKPDLAQLEAAARASQSAAAWRAWAEACTIWGGADSLNDAIAAWDAVLRLKPESAPAHFARGVALRMRYESKHRHDDDFHAAVTAWGRALDLDPNHYIYRRRIQQYGPRLMKPYPFYDWIETARAEIRKRGEEPVSLGVEPGGAEIARPARSFTAGEPGAEPDAQGRIRRDESLVLVNSVVVPAVATPGETVRIHLELAVTKTAHWNNEAEPVQVWINQPQGWQLQQSLFALPQPAAAESSERRRLELEARLPDTATTTSLTGYALYYVCEDVGGQCLYLRRDFSIPVPVRPAAAR